MIAKSDTIGATKPVHVTEEQLRLELQRSENLLESIAARMTPEELRLAHEVFQGKMQRAKEEKQRRAMAEGGKK